jgi:hypothetical protein
LEIFANLVELIAGSVDFFEGKQDSDGIETFLSLSDFPNVARLTLEDCTFSHLPAVFTNFRSLTINNGQGISVLPEFPSLDYLELYQCNGLTELHLTGNGEKYPICTVKILDCEGLNEVRISRKISQLTISSCRTLSRLVVERQINFLRVKRCPKLPFVSPSAHIICSHWVMGNEEDQSNSEEDEEEDEEEGLQEN